VPPELLEGYLGTVPRCEVRAYRNGWVLLFWYEHDAGPMVRTVMTVEEEGEAVRSESSWRGP
jgi:RNA polymerase sigma-70 factor (ECF subfamily)